MKRIYKIIVKIRPRNRWVHSLEWWERNVKKCKIFYIILEEKGGG
jgi:hypothetical protein